MRNTFNCRICGEKIFQNSVIRVPISGMKLYDCERNADCIETSFYVCPECGHGQIEDKLGREYYKKYQILSINDDDYTEKYYTESFISFIRLQINDTFSVIMNNYEIRKRRALDIGCADGSLSKILEEEFETVDGIESSSFYNQFKGNGILYKGFFEDYVFENNYDFVLCVDLIEHIDDLKRFVYSMKEVLDINGIALVMTPNGEKIVNEGHWYDIVGEHLNYFSMNNLCRLFIECGFQLCDCKLIRDGWWLRIVLRKKNNMRGDYLFQKKSIDMKVLNNLADSKKKVSLWGAGVKGASFVESISGKIDILYVFDSNPIKDGRFIPGFKNRIVKPNRESIHESDIIIITALENKRAIEKTLKESFFYKGDIISIDELEIL